ncbi:hypothetical protein ABZ615_18190 [Streptomyces sp. NPDC007325]|uniref:hypothetical protein n=1 Tax=Streptomyces sp. NPDC007325 TaxID=3154588 RepID=UPI0033D2B1C3
MAEGLPTPDLRHNPYGCPDLRRIQAGRYRVLYEITAATATLVVIHTGRLG